MTDNPQDATLDPLDPPQPEPALNFRKRLEELGQMALLVFILASAAFLSAITAMRIAIHGREVTMPNLTGKSVTDATSMLRSHGLVLKVADRVYSELPINVVVRQTPPAGLGRKVTYVPAPKWPHGSVIDQSPLAGSRLPAASTIELTVAN